MKPLTWNRASWLAGTLDPFANTPIDKQEALTYRTAMGALSQVVQYLDLLDSTYEDMAKVRNMLACELHLFNREPFIYILINRHEAMYKDIRTAKITDDLPAYAVWVEKKNPKRHKPPMEPNELNANITKAMFPK